MSLYLFTKISTFYKLEASVSGRLRFLISLPLLIMMKSNAVSNVGSGPCEAHIGHFKFCLLVCHVFLSGVLLFLPHLLIGKSE